MIPDDAVRRSGMTTEPTIAYGQVRTCCIVYVARLCNEPVGFVWHVPENMHVGGLLCL